MHGQAYLDVTQSLFFRGIEMLCSQKQLQYSCFETFLPLVTTAGEDWTFIYKLHAGKQKPTPNPITPSAR